MSLSEPRASELTQLASTRGLTPVSLAYSVAAQDGVFYSTPVLTMSYEVADALDENSFAIYGSTGPGSFVLMPQTVDISQKTIAAELVRSTETVFAIFSTPPAFSADAVPPVSSISFLNTSIHQSGEVVVLSSSALVEFSVTDPLVAGSTTSGAFAVYYWIDVPTTTNPRQGAVIPTEYSNSFALSPGSHTLAYFGVDLAGNAEDIQFVQLEIGASSDDIMPPRTEFAVGLPSATISGATYVSGTSAFGFVVADDDKIVGDALGVGATQTFYSIDGAAFVEFSSSFTLVLEGTRTVAFFSVDLEGNAEATREREVFVDLTLPVTQLNQNGAEISLDAFDPSAVGGQSGISRIRYLVDYLDPDVCNNVAEDTSAARGTCENPWYDGPFTLSNGAHVVRFQAFDNVGNAELAQTEFPNVGFSDGGNDVGGLGIGRDPLDTLWTVNADTESISFAHADSSGALISSATLQDAADGLPWSVFFNASGRAYAIGMAEGLETQALDLAIYKASPSGDAIESRALFDSGYASNDLVFDAKAPGWIVGGAQTAGPLDMDADGDRTLSLALWRFDPALGSVQLSTSTSRAGFDFGSGLAVDADGSLWIVGYSAQPNAPDVGGLDLALRHYAADGQTLLGGPFYQPGYLSHLDGGITAKVHVTADAVYVAAPRLSASGGSDMAFLKFNKATGQALVEKVWRAADGSSSYPVAILPEATGLLVAGGIGDFETDAGLWRFGYDGGFLSATTTDAGGAQGAVFKGGELWLSVDGSTMPYRVQDEVAAAGALIDLVPPRTSLSAGQPSFAGDSTIYVTSAAPLGFAVVDDYLVPGDGLGAGATQTFYAEAGGAYSRFTSSFTLVAEGTHTISFYSIDLAGRVETVKTQTVGVDLTAPVVTLVSSGSLFSLLAVDPVVGGVASGVREIQYLVDQDPECDVVQSAAAPPGTCENLAYAGPFELAAGTHTIYYAATDRVSNGAEITYSSFVAVSQPSSFLAMSADGLASLSSSRADETVTAVSTESVAAAYAAAVSLQGLVLMSPSLYEISPSPVVFDPPALLSIRFDPSSVSAVAVALYRFDGALWSSAPVTGQQVSVFSTTSAIVSGFLNGASLYGVFSIAPPPLAVSSIDPSSGTNAGSVGVTVTGTGFASGDSLKLSRLSPTANTWAPVGFNFFARSRFPAVTLPNGKVLVEGGEGTTSSPNISGAELFNPSLGTWSMTAPMPVPRRYHTATLLNSGRVLVAGGVGGNSTALLYDPSAESWSATGSMSSGHYYHTATLMPNGKVLVAGGFDAGATAACAVYDPAAGTFSPTQSLSSARYQHTATLLPDGRVLVAGGLQGSTALASTEIYDPSAGTWSPGAPMAINREYHTATLLKNGKVLVAGGTANESSPRASAEVYDPAADAWTTVGSMASPRSYHTATLLSNGLVLVAGGIGSGFLSSAELYDPAVGAWSAAPSMATARLTHAAALLADGRVLITGGQNANGKVRAAEVYSPVSNVEITATGVNVPDSTRLTGTFDLTNRPLGSWNVVVTDVDGSSAALNGGFTVLAVSPPAAVGNLALSVVNLSSVTLRWTAPSAAGGIAVTSYDLRVATFVITAANFASATPVAAPAPASPGVVQTAAVANAAGTSFFAALISRDAANTPSSLSNVPGLQRSAVTINGGPELSAWAGIPLSLSMVSTVAAPGSVAVATAAAQGLVRVSSLYELGPQGAFFSPSGTLVFRYSTAALTALGLTSADVRVYQYVGGSMTMLPAQTLNASAQTFTVSISSPPALVGLFGFVPAPAVASIAPNSGTNTGSIGVTLSGTGLRASNTLKLSRASAAANTWTAEGSLLTARSRFPAVLLPNGKVLVEGGEGNISSPDISAAELFNPSSETWSMTMAMPGSRRYHTATVLPNGKVLVAGGVGGETTALLYDPAAGTWTSAGIMVSSHYYHTATLLPSGQVLIAGGHVVGGGTAACEIYDPVAGTFVAAQQLTGARYQHTATLLPDGRVVVAGGFHDNTSDALSSVEIYDPSAGTWSPGASMSSARGFHTATLLDDGTILAAGGMNGASLFASAEVYDPSADAWAGVGAMSAARALHTATRLPDGRVLAAGGNAGGVLDSAEFFDPGTGAWSAASSLLVARTAHAAVPLPDGRVLLAGGQNVNSPLNSAEIYTPIPPADIIATGIASPSASLLTGVFDLAGQPTGTWDVVVDDVFGRSSILRDGFTVAAPARPAAVADLSIAIESALSLTLSWTAPASAAPLASYDLRRATFPITAANFASASPLTAPSPAAPGVVQSFVVADAAESSFFAALKSVDSLGGVSALSNVVSRVRSAAVVGGQPEFTFSANVPISFVPVSTATAPGTIVLATSSAQGLTLVSSIYDLGPEGAVFNPYAQMTFVYSPDALASLGLLPGDIKIYQYVPGAGMVEVSSQTIDTAANTITGYVPSLSSIFAVFGVVKDRAAPITSLTYGANGTFTDGAGNLYTSPSAGFGFSAYDPVVAATASGVAYTNYRVDGPSTAPFSRFASTFSLSAEGLHELAFFSADNAGNVEVVRSSAVSVDTTAPVTTPQVLGSSVAGVSGGLAVSSAAAISLSAVDPVSNGVASGLGGVFYVVDADPALPACAGATPDAGAPNGTCANPSYAGSFSLPAGEHVVYYFAKDNVANAETRGSLPVLVDAAAPESVLLVDGVPMTASGAVLVSTNTLGLSASDSGAGVSHILYALDGTVEQVYASTFTLPAGSHVISFRGVDRVGNVETARSVTLDVLLYDAAPPTASFSIIDGSTITTDVPLIVAAYGDSGRGVDVSSVRLALDGVDVTTRAAVSASSAAFSAALAQGAHVVSISLADLAGNEASAAARFFVDSLPPETILQVNGLDSATTALVVVSTDAFGFVSADAGTGVARTEYALDGGVPTVYTSTFSLAAGAHSLVFFSVDDAGNAEAPKNVALDVLLYDVTPPAVVLTPAVGSTVATTAPQIAAVYSDAGRGVDAASIRLSLDGVDVTAQAVVTASSAVFTSSAPLSEGAHVVAVQVADLAGNQASAASTFTLDSIAPVTTLLVNGQAAGNGGLILASTDSVAFAAIDAGTGVLETLYSLDGTAEAVFVSTLSLSPGGHSLAFRSRDGAGNLETAQVVSITVTSPVTDTTPPLVRLDFPGAAASGIEQALGGVVDVRGAVTDASAVSWTLEAAPGAAAAGGFTAIASGAGNLSGLIAAWNTAALSGYQTMRFRAVDAFGNAAQATATVFVGAPVMTFAIGRKNSDAIVSDLKGPTGIAVRSDGSIWVASTENDQILLISPAGVLLGAAGRAPGHSGDDKEDKKGKKDKDRDDEERGQGDRLFKTPQGLALDAAGSLYVADRDLNRVVKLSPDGQTLLLQFGRSGSGLGELRRPFDVAVDANGDVYAADSGNRRVAVFDASGAFLREFGAAVFLSTSEIRGLALTSEGLWVTDKELEVIHLFSRSGGLIKTISGADSAVGELSRMRGLASDRLGALYVVEPNRDRVQKFDPRGKGLLAFGTKAGLSLADKKAKRWLTQPIDAAVAPDGSIWVTDTGRDRIVRYALPPADGGLASLSSGGGEFASESEEPARRVVDHKDGAAVSRDDGSGVRVPKGALAADLEITVEKGDENVDKEPKEAKRRELKITAVSDEIQYGPEGTTFSAPVTLTIPYDANLMASRGLREDDLKVYYWNPTLQEWQAMPSTVDKKAKTVNAETTHFSAYQVGALGGIGVAAVDDFGLRDGYAFPNPSRNGSAVTFRMQPGSADSIEVRVYDVAGRKVHSSSDFRFLGAVDDGNGKGAQNTYDHVWNVSGVGSGVYRFVITAKKSGQPDVRKTGGVGVIK